MQLRTLRLRTLINHSVVFQKVKDHYYGMKYAITHGNWFSQIKRLALRLTIRIITMQRDQN